jgi:hypothetical protein
VRWAFNVVQSFGHPFLMTFDSKEEASTCRKGTLGELSAHPVSSEKLLTAIQEALNEQHEAALIYEGVKSVNDVYQLHTSIGLQQPYTPGQFVIPELA